MLGTGQQCIVQYGHVVCHCLPACCTYLITCPPHPAASSLQALALWTAAYNERQASGEQDAASDWQHFMAGISQ
jgi:hypothetical protein